MTSDPPAPLVFPKRDEDRLRLAIRRLEEALALQASAMRDFRASLGGLAAAVGGLERGLAGYQAQLATVAQSVDQANQAARTLEATADRWATLH